MNEVKNIIKLNKICVQFGVISIVIMNIWYSYNLGDFKNVEYLTYNTQLEY